VQKWLGVILGLQLDQQLHRFCTGGHDLRAQSLWQPVPKHWVVEYTRPVHGTHGTHVGGPLQVDVAAPDAIGPLTLPLVPLNITLYDVVPHQSLLCSGSPRLFTFDHQWILRRKHSGLPTEVLL